MKPLKDQFSAQSEYYRKFRPIYPQELYNFIFTHVSKFENCWDCATGNGQVATVLADHFQNVHATDISQNQISKAPIRENIKYSVQRAEATTFPDQFFDLITVGQALHWFDYRAFNKEVSRVIKPDGVLAVWGYGLFRVNEEIDKKIDHFYKHIIGPYWAFERSHVDNEYRTLPLYLEEIPVDNNFSIDLEWSLDHLEGYLNSWSATQNYKKANFQKNPVPELIGQLKSIWPDKAKVRTPLFLRMGTLGS